MMWKIFRNKKKEVVGVSVISEPVEIPQLYTPKPYVEPTVKEILEALEFQDNYEAAYLITSLKKENMILKGKLTKLTKKYEACEADRLMYIQQLNHLHGHGETE